MKFSRILVALTALVLVATINFGLASADDQAEQPAQHAAQVPDAEPPPDPPQMISGSAAALCAAITEAGYSPHDYPPLGGNAASHE